jgi:hypothetical protein
MTFEVNFSAQSTCLYGHLRATGAAIGVVLNVDLDEPAAILLANSEAKARRLWDSG